MRRACLALQHFYALNHAQKSVYSDVRRCSTHRLGALCVMPFFSDELYFSQSVVGRLSF